MMITGISAGPSNKGYIQSFLYQIILFLVWNFSSMSWCATKRTRFYGNFIFKWPCYSRIHTLAPPRVDHMGVVMWCNKTLVLPVQSCVCILVPQTTIRWPYIWVFPDVQFHHLLTVSQQDGQLARSYHTSEWILWVPRSSLSGRIAIKSLLAAFINLTHAMAGLYMCVRLRIRKIQNWDRVSTTTVGKLCSQRALNSTYYKENDHTGGRYGWVFSSYLTSQTLQRKVVIPRNALHPLICLHLLDHWSQSYEWPKITL